MNHPTYVLLYVANPPASADFYASLLGKAPVESSPGFALFVLDSGLKLGLWKRDEVQPAAPAPAGGSELCLTAASQDEVRATHTAWSQRGLRIAQPPTEMDFGYTFLALDPDGHRLRVFFPAG